MSDRPIKVLLVEDSLPLARLLTLEIQRIPRANLDLKHAGTLEEAFECVREESFDIVLLDLSLPDSTGLATLTNLRAQAPEVAIIILTALDDGDVAHEALRLGAREFLIKGDRTRTELLPAIQRALAREPR